MGDPERRAEHGADVRPVENHQCLAPELPRSYRRQRSRDRVRKRWARARRLVRHLSARLAQARPQQVDGADRKHARQLASRGRLDLAQRRFSARAIVEHRIVGPAVPQPLDHGHVLFGPFVALGMADLADAAEVAGRLRRPSGDDIPADAAAADVIE